MNQKGTNGHIEFKGEIDSYLGRRIMDLGLRVSISRWYMGYFVNF